MCQIKWRVLQFCLLFLLFNSDLLHIWQGYSDDVSPSYDKNKNENLKILARKKRVQSFWTSKQ